MERISTQMDAERAAWGALMARAQNGDKDAYRRLLAGFTPALRRYFRRRVRNEEAVEDLVQETLLSIHRARHSYLPDQPFSAWALTIGRNAMLDWFHRQKRRSTVETTMEQLPDTPAEQQLDGDGLEQAEALLAGLPAGQREAVRLTKLEGLPVASAAKQLGISESALKVRVHRALQSLKSLQLDEGEPGAV